MKKHLQSATTLLPVCAIFALTALALTLTGCAMSADLARYRNDICEIHGSKMEAIDLKGLPGTSASLPNFTSARDTRFPHYGGPRWSGDTLFYHAGTIRDYVCPQCTAAYNQWRAEHPELKL